MNLCGQCGMEIHSGDAVRYFGFWSAHMEWRCVELLKMRIAELQARIRVEGEYEATR